MPDYVTLMGAEQVQNAGQSIRGSAEQMDRAAQTINESVAAMTRSLDDFICRMEKVSDNMARDVAKLEKLIEAESQS